MRSYKEYKEIGAMSAAEILQQVHLDVGQSTRKLNHVIEYLRHMNHPKLNAIIPLLKKHADELNRLLDEV